jgi:methylase of polypeptide subunit release factors
MSRLSLGGALYKSPVDTSKNLRVLDIGTGTGIWSM